MENKIYLIFMTLSLASLSHVVTFHMFKVISQSLLMVILIIWLKGTHIFILSTEKTHIANPVFLNKCIDAIIVNTIVIQYSIHFFGAS